MTNAKISGATETLTSVGTLTAVAVVHKVVPKFWEEPLSTAIDKRPVEGRVQLQSLGLAGDVQCDRANHGGVYAAVYAYADEDAAWWARELDREITPGLFGENLRTSNVDVTGAEIGEQWQVGAPDEGVLLEVTAPRAPCRTFQERMAEPHWVKRFAERNAPGAYLRVLTAGSVAAGDDVRVVLRPGHGVTLGHVANRPEASTMNRLLDAAERLGLDLEPGLRHAAVKISQRG